MNNRLKGNLLVLGQFVLLAALIFYPRSAISYGVFSFVIATLTIALMFVGFLILAFSFLALGKSLTAHPIPTARAVLVTDGLYRFSRHPIYTGLILVALSLFLSGGLFPHLIFFAVLVLLLSYKASFEEKLLAARYPDYLAYAAKTGRFFPRLKK
jgi:protein-S-isoprenylcysteine O-methyltransferase Ste14